VTEDSGTAAGVWKATLESAVGVETVLINLDVIGSSLTGQISSPRIGTVAITDGAVNDELLTWRVPIDKPFSLDAGDVCPARR
jgi:hypothetical protein